MPIGLSTDLYELTMAAGYVAAGKSRERGVFEMFVRQLPPNRHFLIAAGLEQAVEYLLNLRFTSEEIDYLRGLSQFRHAPPEVFRTLAELRFTGDLFAVPEGTPVFAGEPLMTVRAPLVEGQIAETYLLSTIAFQTMIASKAARVAQAAAGRTVVEFGTRRAHSPAAGLLAARAAYIGGCAGTSNADAGFRFGIPVYGTCAHSWIQSFSSEMESFRRLQELLREATVYLIDTYDTLEGARKAASLGRPLWGVRIDSGNLRDASAQVRRIFDEAGLNDAKIMVSGDLNEDKIRELGDAPIDAFGVGTDLATSSDAPNLGAVYKLVELEIEGIKRYTFKSSENKETLPGAKQIFRYASHDVVGCSWECPSCPPGATESEALLRPVMLNGQLVDTLPTAGEVRERAGRWMGRVRLDESYRVEYSYELRELARRTRVDFERAGVARGR